MVRVSVPARLAFLSLLRGAVGGLESYYAGHRHAPAPPVIWGWGLAVHEAATNIVRHGYDGGSDAPITLEIVPSADQVEFVLEDAGRPNAAWPYRCEGPLAFEDGGYGLRILHEVMDELIYRPDPGRRNVLIMRCRFAPEDDATLD